MAQVQLTTDVKNYEYRTFTCLASNAQTQPSLVRVPTTTQPASTDNSILFGGVQNYLKLQVLSSTSATKVLYVWGWNFMSERMVWVPQILGIIQFTFGGTKSSTAFGSLNVTSGIEGKYPLTGTDITNLKVFNTSAVSGYGTAEGSQWALIDCLGSQFIEITAIPNLNASPTPDAASTVHILSSSI
jgi:hypothetical protein